MGTPWFKLKDLARQRGILAFSSNYALYGDMSNRVATILRDFSPDIEVYSVDESFLRIEAVAHLYGGVPAMGRQMRERIKQWTGLPVCVGCGPTKTLAKLANHLAKKNAVFNGVCDLHALSRPERLQWMHKIEVGEVWGVGRRLVKLDLQALDIHTVLDLRNASPKQIRAQFGVVMERTCSELRGVSCLELEDLAPPKQQIMSSRSFGTPAESDRGTERGRVDLRRQSHRETAPARLGGCRRPRLCADQSVQRQRAPIQRGPLGAAPRPQRRHKGADPVRFDGVEGDLQAGVPIQESGHHAHPPVGQISATGITF
jgi:nucleotidyltransferase/DNA polymerase involved in DNA repair